MGFVLAGLAVVIVLGIAAWAIKRESARLAAMPPRPTFNLDDALDWVVDNLGPEAAATLNVDDVRLILDLQVEYFRLKGVSVSEGEESVADVVVIGGPETTAYIVRRAGERGATFIEEQVEAVIETQLDYLREIGAIGPRAAEGEV